MMKFFWHKYIRYFKKSVQDEEWKLSLSKCVIASILITTIHFLIILVLKLLDLCEYTDFKLILMKDFTISVLGSEIVGFLSILIDGDYDRYSYRSKPLIITGLIFMLGTLISFFIANSIVESDSFVNFAFNLELCFLSIIAYNLLYFGAKKVKWELQN